MLIDAGLDRVHMTTLLSGTEPAGPETHGTRTLHGSEILFVIDGGPRRPPVSTKWQPVQAHGAGNSGQVQRTTGLPHSES